MIAEESRVAVLIRFTSGVERGSHADLVLTDAMSTVVVRVTGLSRPGEFVRRGVVD
jgi:hypothetical protein